LKDYLKELDPGLVYIKHTIENGVLKIYCETAPVPDKPIHSRQERIVRDLPFGEYKVELHIIAKKYFNPDPIAKKRTIAETFPFVNGHGRRTKRLEEWLVRMSTQMSSIGLERLVRKQVVDISDSTIIRLVKKNIGDSPKL
jgi:hypothetical protein